MAQTEQLYQTIHSHFGASISRKYDCGRICAPLNGGEPVCCSTDHAIPVVDRSEWNLLKKRTQLWKLFDASDPESRKFRSELPSSCAAIECKGAAHCEREHRTLACRSFPFFPYFDRNRHVLGITVYWTYEDRCWIASNLRIVERSFISEFLTSYELLFEADEQERNTFVDYSASMRRVFSRWKRPIPVLKADGKIYKVLPGADGELHPARWSDFPPGSVFASDRNYRAEIRAQGYEPGTAALPNGVQSPDQ